MKYLFSTILLILINSCSVNYVPKSYYGKGWNTQKIPGKIECEFYDNGGEGIAYHDADSINNGSGKLNPANGSFLNEFRMKEGMDISYTKSNNVDNNPYNEKEPLLNKLYVGWTKPGEWINYTVEVKQTGLYKTTLMYTANGDGAIAFDVDGKRVAGSIKIPSTHNDKDTVAWRQWHHWNKLDSLTTLDLTKGKHLITLHVTENGNMNFDYIEFIKQ